MGQTGDALAINLRMLLLSAIRNDRWCTSADQPATACQQSWEGGAMSGRAAVGGMAGTAVLGTKVAAETSGGQAVLAATGFAFGAFLAVAVGLIVVGGLLRWWGRRAQDG